MGFLHSIASRFVKKHFTEYDTNGDNLQRLREITKALNKSYYEQCNLEHKCRDVVHSSTESLMLTEPDGTIAYMSANCSELLGHDVKDLIDMIPCIVHPDDVERVKPYFYNALSGIPGQDLVYRIVTKSGDTKIITHSWAPLFIDEDLYLVVSIIRKYVE